jgi:branched-chain amino acid transport system substrate-binding protein
MMGPDGLALPEFWIAGGSQVEGTLMTYAEDPGLRPSAATVVKKFRAKGFDPEAWTLYAYAAVEVLKQAAETAKTLDPLTLAEVMKTGRSFDTVLGPISFDEKGDRKDLDYGIFVWRKIAGQMTYTPMQ